MEEAKTDIVTVDLKEVALLAKQGKDIIFTPEAEEALERLLYLEDVIAKAKETAKKLIEEAALKYNVNFKSVQGDKIKAGYQMYGSKYVLDAEHLDKIPKDLYNTHVSYRPIGKMIDEFVKDKGALPLGINPAERRKQITFRRLKDFMEVVEDEPTA